MSSSASKSHLSTITPDKLNKFVQTEVEPDTEYIGRCNAVVDRLSSFIKNNFPDDLKPSSVLKCGSLGKGTAVKGMSDVDLVVFLANIQSISELDKKLRDIFVKMTRYLGKYGGCHVTGTTTHAVQVSVHCQDHSHDVDILPSVDILQGNKKKLLDIYKEMESAQPLREYYSAALSPLQIDFVSNVPPKVKNLIRLMKLWKNTDFEKNNGKQRLPPSYLLELIVIGEWEQAESPENFDLRKGFYHVLTAITNYKTMRRLVSTKNYTSPNCHDAYYVMDPANPFNNVMSDCNCWEDVAEKARHFLETAKLFKGSSNLTGWL